MTEPETTLNAAPYYLASVIKKWGLDWLPFYSDVNSMWGAPMGRANSGPLDVTSLGPFIVVPMSPCQTSMIDYDLGGAYWGHRKLFALVDMEEGCDPCEYYFSRVDNETLAQAVARICDETGLDPNKLVNLAEYDDGKYAIALAWVEQLLMAEAEAEHTADDMEFDHGCPPEAHCSCYEDWKSRATIVYSYDTTAVRAIENGANYDDDDWSISPQGELTYDGLKGREGYKG